MPKRRLLSTGQAADELGIARSTLWRAVQSGEINPTEITPGGHLRFEMDDLRRQIRANAQQRAADRNDHGADE